MRTRTLYRSYHYLFIGFLLALSGCTSTPVNPPKQAPAKTHSANDWLELARTAPVGQRAEYQLKAAQLFWQQGEIDSTKNILRSIPRQELQDQAIGDYLALGAGIIELERGSTAAVDWLNAEPQQILLQRSAPAQQLSVYALLANLQDRSDQHFAAASNRVHIAPLLVGDRTIADNQSAIWQSLMQAPAPTLKERLASRLALEPVLRGWCQLALLAQTLTGDIDQQVELVDRWRHNWPTHPAALSPPGDIDLLHHLAANKPAQIAVLLPMHGPLKDAGYAIRDGILSAHFDARTRGATSSSLTFYDTETSTDMAALYRQAVARGAELIIGPLRKNRVEALLQFSDGMVPVLALNYAPNEPEAGDNFYQFGLSSADDARAAAARARELDYHRAIVIHGIDKQSTRSAQAFQQAWQTEGGETVAEIEFDSDRSASERIKQGLHVDRSQQRARVLESIIGTNLEYNPRRRQDIDFVYLPVGAQQARSINPLLAFHFAQDLPVFATSRVYRGKPDPRGDADLNGVYFTDTPWALGAAPNQQQRISDYIERGGAPSKNLYALGIDALRLAPRIPQMLYSPNLRFEGLTGSLSLSAQGAILRRPSWAIFRGGVATLLMEKQHESMDAQATENQNRRQ